LRRSTDWLWKSNGGTDEAEWGLVSSVVLELKCCREEEVNRVVEGFNLVGYDMVVWHRLAFISFEHRAGGDVVEVEGGVGEDGLGGVGGWMAWVQASSVGKYGILFSGNFSLRRSQRRMNSGQFLPQLM
jgi:hypothetical protein